MTQVARRSTSGSSGKRRGNATVSAAASEWAAKRQAKMEAAQAKKQLRDSGEITEQHTFRPQTGRPPQEPRREASAPAGSPFKSKAMDRDFTPPRTQEYSSREYRETYADLNNDSFRVDE